MPAVSSSPTTVLVDESAPIVGELFQVSAARVGLLREIRGRVPDPRTRRGIRHPIAVILAVALSATLAGARSFTAVAEGIAEAPEAERARLGITGTGAVRVDDPPLSALCGCRPRRLPDRGVDLAAHQHDRWPRGSSRSTARRYAGPRTSPATWCTYSPGSVSGPTPCSDRSR